MADASDMSAPPGPPDPAASPDPLHSAMVFTRDREAEVVIRQSLSNLIPSAEFVNGNVDVAIVQLAHRSSPRLLIVDVSGSSDPAAEVRNMAEVCDPGCGVIVIGDSNDIRLYRDLRQAGVVEYYFKPLVATLVTGTASGILTGSGEQRGSRTGKLVTVIGVRGGVGATTIATSAAWFLSEKRQRRIALLDLDMYAGDAALQFNVTPTHALCEALEHPERIDELFLARAMIAVTERLSLLASLESYGNLVAPTEDSVLSLLGKMTRRYRFVLVDMPANIAPRLPRVLHLPGIVLLVSNASLVSARDIARWRELVGPSSSERQVLHILNRNGAHGSLPPADFARAAGQAPDITIPYDRAIGNSSNMGVAQVQKSPTLQRGLAPLFSLMAGEPTAIQHSLFERTLDRLHIRP